ncbi:MAG: type II toxin-antitoxin system PemK/MazF family toxin [Saprospiraceae bacterium]|nr:type II toxin-antitoxin system PemK/MazF family toxin [Saprospiraceae bacterium]
MTQGEIWQVNLDPTLGAEIKKSRPAIIVSDDSVGILPLRVIVPLTEWKPQYGAAPWMVKVEPTLLNDLSKPSAADCFQLRSVSQIRFLRKIGDVSPDVMAEIGHAIKTVLNI